MLNNIKRTETTNYHWDIQYMDIDPDSGDATDPKTVATTKWPNYANLLLDALISNDQDPNRHYFIVKCVNHSIRDEEIEKGAEDWQEFRQGAGKESFEQGAKWYREQLKLKQPYVSDDFQIGPDGAYEHTDYLTQAEKAAELIVDFQLKCKSLEYDEAKQCAVIMVDGIKKILYDQDSMIRYDYWFEVKKELEKL